jgi:hypothetical protein
MVLDDMRLLMGTFAARFRDQKQMAEKALAQVPDVLLHTALDDNTNSLAVIAKHMGGNLRSRFTDFLTSDGEKPDRDRDSEFVEDKTDRAAMMAAWDAGWECLFKTLAELKDEDLARMVKIRGQPHTVADALLRALGHQSYHVGQIVQLARHLAKDNWQTLTIPRGGSGTFNVEMKKMYSS